MMHIPFETFLECGHRSSSHSIVLDAHRISDTTTRFSLYKEDCTNLIYRFYLTSVDRPHAWPYSETNNNNLIIYMPLNASRIRYILSLALGSGRAKQASLIDSVYQYEYDVLELGLTKHIWKYFMAKRVARRCRAIYAKRRQAADVICRFIDKCYLDPTSAYCKRRLLKEYMQLKANSI